MTTYGYKRTVVGAHYGWRDWLVQRITALIMILFTLTVIAQLVFSKGNIGYALWAGIFAAPMDEVSGLLRDRCVGLACLGRHVQHLDGLRQAGRNPVDAAGFHDCLARRLRRLGLPGSVASLSVAHTLKNKAKP
jgi:hypothetical protein